MDFDKLMENDAFKNIDAERVQMLKKISEEIKGKNAQQVLSVLSSYKSFFSGANKITDSEKKLMISVILEQLSDEEKEKFNKIMKMMNL